MHDLYRNVVSRMMKTPGMRIAYKGKEEAFTEDQLVAKEPFGQFDAWFSEAAKIASIEEPNAMALATATKYVNSYYLNICIIAFV